MRPAARGRCDAIRSIELSSYAPARMSSNCSASSPLNSRLLPRQAFLAPAADASAMVLLVERAFEAIEHVVDLAEAGLLERLTCADRALAAATDHDDRPIHAGDL